MSRTLGKKTLASTKQCKPNNMHRVASTPGRRRRQGHPERKRGPPPDLQFREGRNTAAMISSEERVNPR